MATYSRYTTNAGEFWQVRGFLGYDPRTGNKRELQKRGFTSKQEAQDYYKERQKRFNAGKDLQESRRRFEDVYNEWLEIYRQDVRKSTLTTTKNHFNTHILPALGHFPISKIPIPTLQKLANEWNEQYIEGKRFFNHVKRVLAYAVIMDYIQANPCDKIIRPKHTKAQHLDRSKYFYTREELKSFLEALKNDHDSLWFMYFHLLAYTGARRGEALALTWQDVNFSAQTLTIDKTVARAKDERGRYILEVHPPKNGKTRTIALDDQTVQLLKQWKTESARLLLGFGFNALAPSQLIFPRFKTNKHIHPATPQNVAKRITKRHGLPYLNVHGFRHTHASLLFQAGADMKDVQTRLGHSNIEMTLNIYTHVTQEQETKTAQLFAKYMTQ
ncbi:MAG: site-specific integrase [Aerococcus sp.]|nr:site-specific integrase [Aerococcus sp.]